MLCNFKELCQLAKLLAGLLFSAVFLHDFDLIHKFGYNMAKVLINLVFNNFFGRYSFLSSIQPACINDMDQ